MHIVDTFDLESVRVFQAAARLGSLRATADKFGINHSTASRRIQSLEDVVGAKLLKRTPDGIVLTDVGRRILAASSGLDEISARLAGIASSLKSQTMLTFTAPDGVAGYWLPILLSEFPEDHPDITLRVRCRDVGRGADISTDETDIDVSYVPPSDPDSVVLGKATMPGRMFGSKAYVERHGMPRTLDELIEHRACILDAFLDPNLGGGDWERYAKLLARHDMITYQTNSALALGFAIRSGWGLGSQPAMVEVTEPDMVMLPKEVYDVAMQFWLVVHRDMKDNPATRLLTEWIKKKMIRSFKEGRATFEVSG